MMGKEVQVLITDLSRLMAAKIDKPIFLVKGWVNSWISLSVAMSYYQVLRGDRVPSLIRK